MTHLVTMIAGDGIGQEVMPAARQVIEALDLPITLQEAQAGWGTFDATGTALPDETIAMCAESDAILFGATQSPMTRVEGYHSPILALRKQFDCYANIRPARLGDIDVIVVRENSEGLYSRQEHFVDDDTAITERVITRHASERIVRIASDYAMRRRKKLTLVHKANVLKATCGLFRETAWDVVKDYPELQIDEKLVDAMAMFLVQDATPYDVIVTTNLFGDILSDLMAGLTGGLGIAPSASIGVDKAIFEPVHGSAPDIAGQQVADPRAMLASVAMMFDWLGYQDVATHLQKIIDVTPHSGDTHRTIFNIIHAL